MEQSVTDSTEEKEQTSPAPSVESTTDNTEGQSQPSSDEKNWENEVARRDATISTLQKQLNALKKDLRATKRNEKILKSRLHKIAEEGYEVEDSEPAPQEQNISESLLAEREIFRRVASNPKYASVLEEDKTLKRILLSKPLALVEEFTDADDAVDQIEEMLNKRLAEKEKSLEAEKQKALSQKPASQPQPNITEPVVNPTGSTTPVKKVKPTSIEESIRSRVRFSG